MICHPVREGMIVFEVGMVLLELINLMAE